MEYFIQVIVSHIISCYNAANMGAGKTLKKEGLDDRETSL